jgi:hypothetical protein
LNLLALVAPIAAAALVTLVLVRFGLPTILGYLEGRSIAAWRVLVAEYIAGRISLDLAAVRFNEIEYRIHRYGVLAMRLRPGGPSYLRSFSLTPPGCRTDDPRLHALTERASLLHFGPERFAEIRASLRKQRDSDASSQPDGAV